MNATLMLYTLRQRLLQIPRVILLVAAFTFPILFMLVARGLGLTALSGGHAFAIILGAGLLGSDVSAGVLQLLFARPVTRTEYVLSRWFAVGAAAATLAVLQIAIGVTLMQGAGTAPPASVVVTHMLEQALNAFGMTSVLLFFSCLIPGIGDVVALFCGQIAATLLSSVGGLSRQPIVERAGRELQGFLQPQFSWAAAFAALPPDWFHIATYLSTVTLAVAVAVYVTNRRELSYASA